MSARWAGDPGGGMGSGSAFAPGVRHLADTMAADDWVTEDPEAHLLPHIRRHCEDSDGEWTLVDAALDGLIYSVTLEWHGEPARMGAIRAAAFALIGGFAEVSSYVRQRVADDQVVYEVATGQGGGDTHFHPHGHLVRLHVTGAAAREVAAGVLGGP